MRFLKHVVTCPVCWSLVGLIAAALGLIGFGVWVAMGVR
jgi:hypothetical protein